MSWFGKKQPPPTRAPIHHAPPKLTLSLADAAPVGVADNVLLLTERADPLPPDPAVSAPPPPAVKAAPPKAAPSPLKAVAADSYWTQTRIDAAEFLWGEDNLGPGDGAIAAGALADLPITVASQVLIASAGLGGLSRVLARHYGCWPTSMTPSAALAGIAQQRSDAAELSQKAAVTAYDPATAQFKANSFDIVAAHEILTPVANKARLMQQIVRAAKRGGTVVITEMVMTELGVASLGGTSRRSAAAGEALQAWLKLMNPTPQLWSHAQMMETFFSLNVDAASKNISPAYVERINKIWGELSGKLEAGTIPRPLLPTVATDSERWAAFRTALDEDAIAMTRYTIKI
ncbi:methyltransferase domain-containing protein [Elstera sp.]|jgi:ubiquinone/menaquinone biosynthesis C-methylase UbiE|uniref:methyltransferase domain-containing protein n=1 Tax=Elstera sp. TaxID=1916664 RepID=UPI0037C11307